ncbi:hypothetical protein Hanom_Chr16g01417831 [Helianthus anomalus]
MIGCLELASQPTYMTHKIYMQLDSRKKRMQLPKDSGLIKFPLWPFKTEIN